MASEPPGQQIDRDLHRLRYRLARLDKRLSNRVADTYRWTDAHLARCAELRAKVADLRKWLSENPL